MLSQGNEIAVGNKKQYSDVFYAVRGLAIITVAVAQNEFGKD